MRAAVVCVLVLVLVATDASAIRLAGVSPGGSSSGAYDLEGGALTCSDTGNVTLTCGDDTSMVANVNTNGSFDITDGTTTYELKPGANGLALYKNGGGAGTLDVDHIRPVVDSVFEISTVFDFNTSAAQLSLTYGTNEITLTGRTSTYGFTLGMFQDGILGWSTGTAASSAGGAQVKQTTAEDGILIRTSTSSYGVVQLEGVAFASLPASPNGTIAWCTDCTKATPCAGAGTGAFAKRMSDTWDCD